MANKKKLPLLSISGFEVYETETPEEKEEREKKNKKEEIKLDSEEDEEEEETEDTSNVSDTQKALQRFVARNGEIREIAYFDNMFKNSYDEDYEGISNTGSVSFTEIDKSRFFKGKKICLKKTNDTGEKVKWKDLSSCLLGFISDITFTVDGVDLKLVGMSKLLEQEIEFSFTQMKRSEILKQMIEAAGLKANIDVTGLNDDVIDYTNVSSSGDDSDTTGAYSEDAGKLAKEVCKGKKTDRAKAEAIHKWIANNIQYPSPNYSDHQKCPSEVIKSGYSNCCDRARLGHEMANAVNVSNRGVHGPNHVWLQYKLSGDWVDSDPSQSRQNLGEVYEGMSMDSVWEFETC